MVQYAYNQSTLEVLSLAVLGGVPLHVIASVALRALVADMVRLLRAKLILESLRQRV